MVPLYTPETESEAAVIASLLDAYQIPFFIRGGGFSKLYPGIQINHYNTQTFMVSEAELVFARELIADFISQSSPLQPTSTFSLWGKLRMIFEALVFGWFVPNRRNLDEDKDNK